VIEANDPRLKTAEGWDELGAPFDATHWVGPHENTWEKHEGNNRVTWVEEVKQWSGYTFAVRTGVDEIACDYTVIPRPISEDAKAELTLEPMTDSDGEEIVTSYNSDSDKFKAENKWHDRIDFPFAGTECEMYVVSGWHLARIIGMDEEGLCVASVHFGKNRGYHSSAQIADFRPLKTDPELQRDVDIREALEHIKQDWYAKPGATVSEYVEDAVAQLYDAGWRKTVNVTTTGLCPVPVLYDDDDDDHVSVKGTQ